MNGASLASAPTKPNVMLLLQALDYAAQQHRDQRRKGAEGAPYINHPVRVATVLAEIGGIQDVELLCAAILHDTVEDTDTTPAELVKRFGERVAGIVSEVSDDKSLSKAERKRLQIAHAPHLSAEAKALKLADKVCNVTDIHASPPDGWSRERRIEYLDWASAVIEGLRGANPALEDRFDAVVRDARNALA